MKLTITESHIKQWESFNHSETRREVTCPVACALKEIYNTDNVMTGIVISHVNDETYVKHSIELQSAIEYFDRYGYFAIGDYDVEVIDKKDIFCHIL